MHCNPLRKPHENRRFYQKHSHPPTPFRLLRLRRFIYHFNAGE